MKYPPHGDLEHMSAAEATAYVRQMIQLEALDHGSHERAMKRLARTYGIGFWTLDHLRKNKAKTCDVTLYARIRAAFADHCQRHARRLLEEARTVQAVEHNDDVAAIQREIEALAARLAAAKGQAKIRREAA